MGKLGYPIKFLLRLTTRHIYLECPQQTGATNHNVRITEVMAIILGIRLG